MATVAALFLGGTISMTGRGDEGAIARLSGDELLGAVPGLAELGLAVEARTLLTVPSASLGFADVLDVLVQARAAVAGGATGVVVVQGTDTIEETAFLLDLLWAGAEPLVVTGAMRNPMLAGADGPANLLAALQVASARAARDLGVLVVLNDEIHAARHVVKRHTVSTAAFESPDTGPLGRVVEGEPVLATTVRRRPALHGVERIQARVPIVVAALDDPGTLLDGLDGRCDALVVAGFGGGHVPRGWVDRLTGLAATVPVVLTSRIGAGPALTRTYGAPGSEIDLARRGVLNGGALTAYQARIVLQALLACGERDVAAALATYR